VQSTVIGAALHQQVEDRLKFYDTGVAPTKNADVMKAALEKAGSFYSTPSKSKSEKKQKSERKENRGVEDVKSEKKKKKSKQ
jgi:nucleolar protein 56